MRSESLAEEPNFEFCDSLVVLGGDDAKTWLMHDYVDDFADADRRGRFMCEDDSVQGSHGKESMHIPAFRLVYQTLFS